MRTWLRAAGLALAVATAAAITGCGDSGPKTDHAGSTVVEYSDFVESVRDADFGDYSDSAVADEAAFDDMRQYLLDRYADVDATRSYLAGEITFDCLPAGSEPASEPSAASPPDGAAETADSGADSECTDGTVPVRRVTLDELVAYPTLSDFFSPGKDGPPPTG